MPFMNFDLEDGLPPVSFTLKPQDAERFMAFMAECQAIKSAPVAAPVMPDTAQPQGWEAKAISGLLRDSDFEHAAQPQEAGQAAPAVPEGWKLVPTDLNSVVNMGWVYLDKAREESPLKEWAFSPAGFIAAISAAANPDDKRGSEG